MTISHNRITEPTTMANAETDAALTPIPRSPTGIAALPQILVQIATVICGLAAIGVGLFTAMLPAPWAATGLAICSAIVALGVPLGISSQGIRTSVPKDVTPVAPAPNRV